ncbi:MAG: Ig-like domain-containing protein, partial [Planctomycetota bacterium]|nr:Ig-like domain-containing protein [Planctomycetota bacterium]
MTGLWAEKREEDKTMKYRGFACRLAGCLLALGVGAAAGETTVSLTASTTTPNVNDTFTVTVNLADAPPFANWQALLKFDKTKVELTAQATGTFNTFVPDSRALATINASGEVRSGGFGLSNNGGGNGTLGVFTFKALAAGSTQITTEQKSAGSPFGDVLIQQNGTEVLPAIAGPLNITIGSGGNVPPTVSITSPSSGATFTAPANITITANAADSDGSIAKVEFFNGSTKLGEDTTSPYS